MSKEFSDLISDAMGVAAESKDSVWTEVVEFAKNNTHVLEKVVALIMPKGARVNILYDTKSSMMIFKIRMECGEHVATTIEQVETPGFADKSTIAFKVRNHRTRGVSGGATEYVLDMEFAKTPEGRKFFDKTLSAACVYMSTWAPPAAAE